MSTEEITKVAGAVVTGLQGAPVLLALLVLNSIGIGSAIWFLNTLSIHQSKRMDMILHACLPGAKQ